VSSQAFHSPSVRPGLDFGIDLEARLFRLETGSLGQLLDAERALRFLKDKRAPGAHENRGNIPL